MRGLWLVVYGTLVKCLPNLLTSQQLISRLMPQRSQVSFGRVRVDGKPRMRVAEIRGQVATYKCT